MIDFRYHVVSIIAVFLALALGLFVGSTSLQDAVVHSIKSNTDRVTRENRVLDAQNRVLQSQVSDAQAFDKALLPYAVSGRLSGQLVSVVSAPGVSDGLRKQVLAAVDGAGGTVSADVRLQSALIDPKQQAFLGTLTDRIKIPDRPDTTTAGDAGARAAAQLAAVLGVRPSAKGVAPTTVDSVLAAYQAGKLLSVASSPAARPGTLAIVLAPPAPSSNADAASVSATQQFLITLARDLDTESLGTVLAEPTAAQGAAPGTAAAAASTQGLLQQVSVVPDVDQASGQIATVFALAAQVDGVSGRFGVPPTPLPTRSSTP